MNLKKYKIYISLCSLVLLIPLTVYADGYRSVHIYDNADIISHSSELEIEKYLTDIDKTTSNEIIIYTINSFTGHGITKDGNEINERDMLANYLFNEVPLEGVKGIGKADKNNGVLVLLSLERDGSGGSMRIEVGQGLEGDITDGTAGEILDAYLVTARNEYESNGVNNFDSAFLNTVIAISNATNGTYVNPNTSEDGTSGIYMLIFFIIIFGFVIILGTLTTGTGGTYTSGGWSNSGYHGGGNYGGGGFGSGFSGGGGAGR